MTREEAQKIVRELSPDSRKELKLAIDEAEAHGCGLTLEEMQMIVEHNRIGAIKAIQRRLNCSLLQAKRLADNAK